MTTKKTSGRRNRKSEPQNLAHEAVLQTLGRTTPQAIDMEEAVLGAMLMEKEALSKVIEVLQPEHFYNESNVKIFTAIRTLFAEKANRVDVLTVINFLKKKAELDSIPDGSYYISRLTERIGSAANVEYHARIILEKYIQRQLIKISNDAINDAYENQLDVLDMLDKAESNLFKLAEGNLRKNYQDIRQLVAKAIKNMEELASKNSTVTGVESGFTDLDRLTGGWQKSDLIILAARPGMGKTAFALSLAYNAALSFNNPIGIFSLEMADSQIANRFLSMTSGIGGDKIRKGNLTEAELTVLNKKIGPLTEAPIFIDDNPALSVFELRAKARRLVHERQVKMIIIDYLQLMTSGIEGRNVNREQEISKISRSVKSIAKELEIPIIALSQLSRDVEKRGGNKRPQLSDLRESGAIEQDADMVIFLYRPDYYDLSSNHEDIQIDEGQTEIIVAKNRHGKLDTVNVRFIPELTKFIEINQQNPMISGSEERLTLKSKMDAEF
ncbi:MAG TPA: replicative DNA helicase [Bacteroidia bacterium]|nr:replicative DNA helicase [Bacteroidia bacterium]HNT80823.1 replicative DNA helicase [Bacteroidia bacterium]